MKIKRLEIQGFKSFKDKTIIYFDRPITGIVGPNGSGKSNIVDAFFWVMGEQSYKHIRSSGSDDIIFKGSSKYQPLGLAEATLVMEQEVMDLDGPDGKPQKKEISVTRRVYRSGEGEYFINGAPARLKDIQELFLDTGVGAKGYSVIEQGQIDKVVNSKPEDRRLLIEDAAGIAKYKSRKKESLRKLEAAQGNMTRLQDVIQEIERSLGSLERQAHKARKYKEYRAELLEKETTWGRRKNTLLRTQLEKLASEKSLVEQDLIALRAEVSQCEIDLETQRIHQLTDQKAQDQVHSEVEVLSTDLNHHQSALQLSQKRQEDLQRQLAQLSQEKTVLEEEIAQVRESLATKNEDFLGLDQMLIDLMTRVSSQESSLKNLRDQSNAKKQEAEQRRREFVQLTQADSQAYSQIAALKERLSGSQIQLEKIAGAETRLRAEVVALTTAHSELTENFEQKTIERQNCKSEIETKAAARAVLLAKTKELRVGRDQALRHLTTASSKLSSLEELERTREGMANGPKKVLEWAINSSKDAQFSVLSDFIEVKPDYEMAVEAVLGHAFERLYVRDAEVAFAALRYLQDSREGSAAIQVSLGNRVEAGSGSVARSGYNPLLQHVKRIQPAGMNSDDCRSIHLFIEACLHSVEVLEEAPQAGDIETYRKEGISFVTKNGIWFNAAEGVLFGGSTTSEVASGILARKRTIQELRVEVEALRTHHQTIDAEANATAIELEALDQDLKIQEASLNELEVSVRTLERELKQAANSLTDAEEGLQDQLSQRDQLQVQIASTESQIEQKEQALQENLLRSESLQAWIREHEATVSVLDAQLRDAEDSFQTIKIQEAGEKERKNSLKSQIETENRYCQERERRLAEVDRLLESFSEDRAQYSDGDEGHATEIERLTRALSEKRSELSLIRDRLETSNSEIQTSMERMKIRNQEIESKSAILNQAIIDHERTGGELQHLTANMEEKYGAGCLEMAPPSLTEQSEMTDPVITFEISAEEEKVLHEEVESLRERIRRLGEVNTMAVEEYDDMQKRHLHLLNEKTDLENSIQNLNDAIDHINKTSEERFQKAFHAIAERFERLFPIIFGGGQAKLSLVYPEGSADILDAGVDILAQPPGKKISNMTLLSGGEKALTAISLIFAIFMVKPSPFCILDEVDAPLDDSNIGKFNALVREMSAKSQFILVTHNKKTMELNDTLYGVTMEEPGVSRMVSIQLQ